MKFYLTFSNFIFLRILLLKTDTHLFSKNTFLNTIFYVLPPTKTNTLVFLFPFFSFISSHQKLFVFNIIYYTYFHFSLFSFNFVTNNTIHQDIRKTLIPIYVKIFHYIKKWSHLCMKVSLLQFDN